MQPGDIVVNYFGSGKPRPWLVLWSDEVSACVAACSTQGRFPGTYRIEHPCLHPHGFTYATSWVMVVVREGLHPKGPRIVGNIGVEATREVEAHIAAFLDLRK